MHWHFATLLAALRNHPHALKIYLAAWAVLVIVTAVRWGL